MSNMLSSPPEHYGTAVADGDLALAECCLIADASPDEVARLPLAGGSAAIYSAPSPTKGTGSEDVAALVPLDEAAGVLIVADGLGGHADGQRAARLAVEAIVDTLAGWGNGDPTEYGDQLRSLILNGIEAANRAVMELGTGAATTLALAEIQDGIVRTYHVGDSVVLMTGQRGKLKFQTIPHSPIGYAIEAGLINEQEAMHHEDRHVISNVIGSDEMRIEIGSPMEMSPRDTLLLASDGLVDNLMQQEIVNGVRVGPLDEAVRYLATTATRRMTTPESGGPSKPDDLTIVAFRLSSAGR